MSPSLSSIPTPADLPLHVLAEPLTSQEKKHCVSAIKQFARSHWFAAACLYGCPATPSTSWVKKCCVATVNQSARTCWFAITHTSQNVNQPREEVSCLHKGAVRLLPLIPHRTFVRLFSQTINKPREEASCCCHQSVRPRPLLCSRTY